MNSDILNTLKDEARKAASRLPQPAFYGRFETELDFSRHHFFDHPLILRLQEDVIPFLYDDFGHGIEHAKKVAIEAGALVLAEGAEKRMGDTRHLLLLAQMAGLLHDICRLDKGHACKGADMSAVILRDYPLSDRDRDIVAAAIRSHEASADTDSLDAADPETRLVAAALYDADKFRWGPDNFGTTLWEICDYEEWPLETIIEKFPPAMKRIEEIAGTFRTSTGRSYGPEIIRQGLVLGRDIHQRLQSVDVAASAAEQADQAR